MYRYNACKPGNTPQIVDMALNGNGIRDTSRILHVSPNTVIATLKQQEPFLTHVNPHLLAESIANETAYAVDIRCEMDEQWSYVLKKKVQRWLRHAVDRATNQVLAYVIGPRTDAMCKELYDLLKPFRITHYFTDGWAAYKKYLPAHKHTVTKRETQRIERKHLTFRTRIKRLARKTICFSKSIQMHDIVLGLFINRFEFGLEGQI